MPKFLNAIPVKAVRKARNCHWCGEVIPIGDSAMRTTSAYDGGLHSAYDHPECYDAMESSPASTYDVEVTPFEQERGKPSPRLDDR